MDWLMQLAWQEVFDRGYGYSSTWWAAWLKQLEIYFNLPDCTFCGRPMDSSNTGGNRLCRQCLT